MFFSTRTASKFQLPMKKLRDLFFYIPYCCTHAAFSQYEYLTTLVDYESDLFRTVLLGNGIYRSTSLRFSISVSPYLIFSSEIEIMCCLLLCLIQALVEGHQLVS